MIVESYLAMAGVAGTLLRSPVVAARWNEPSALPEYRISGLAGHIVTASVVRVAEWLAQPVPGEAPIDAVAYYLSAVTPGAPPDDPVSRRVRDQGVQAAADGPAVLADTFDSVLTDVRAAVTTLPPDRLVAARLGVLRLDQMLVTRLIELAVHIDDLAVSLGVPTPEFPPEAVDLVHTTLIRLATAQHGRLPVLRALSRRERQTGPISAF